MKHRGRSTKGVLFMCVLSDYLLYLIRSWKQHKYTNYLRIGSDLLRKFQLQTTHKNSKRKTLHKLVTVITLITKRHSFMVSWLWFPPGPNSLVISQTVCIELITMSNIKFVKGPVHVFMKLPASHSDRLCCRLSCVLTWACFMADRLDASPQFCQLTAFESEQ